MKRLIDPVGISSALLWILAFRRETLLTIVGRRALLGIMICATSLVLSVGDAGEPKADFADTARSIRKAIFQVGNDKNHGTAWVISKKHRLLATNAHVADIGAKSPPGTFRAIMNGTNTTYDVKRVWYHPGISRFVTEDENLAVRSAAFGGYLGIGLDNEFAGVKVVEILPNSAANRAGIKIGDQVLAVNGAMVPSRAEFLGMLARKKPGDAVTLKIARAGKEIDIDAILGERPVDVKLGLGPVAPQGPDLAVLQLSEAGPDLPVELKMAPPKMVVDLQARTVAMMGYPGHDTKTMPKSGQIVQATYHKGDVSRVTNFQLEGTTDEQAQFLQCSLDAFGGFSGSPIFLASGEVVALLNSSRRADPKDKNSRMITHGVRIDSLWELLVHHNLDRLVDVPVRKEQLLVERWLKPDPNAGKYQRLKKLVDEAEFLIFTKEDFAAGFAKCDQAIDIYPQFAPAYSLRARGFLSYRYTFGRQQKEKRLDLLKKGLRDAQANTRLHPAPTLQSSRLELDVLLHLSWETNNKELFHETLEKADDILSLKGLTDWDRACLLSVKATALDNVGQKKDAESLHIKVLQMYPDTPSFWDSMGSFLESSNEAQARIHFAMAKSLRKYFVLGVETKWKDRKVVSEVKESLTGKDPKDNRGCHQHAWTVELEAGYFYRIDLKNPTFTSVKDYDPYLGVADDKNKVLFEDDDGGGYPNARIFFTATRAGNYTMLASSCYPNQTGSYVLTVTRIAKDR